MKRLLATVLLAIAPVAVAVAVTGVGPAHAADGTGLRPGGTACTDLSRSEAGAWAYGRATAPAPVTWTLLASATPGGAETELARRTAWELTSVSVRMPAAGAFHYRACLTNTTTRTVYYGLWAGPVPGGSVARGVGGHTAVVGPGGRACGEWFAGWETSAARLVGTASAPVRFSVRVTNGDGELLAEVPVGAGTSIDRALAPTVDEAWEVCLTNTGTGPATASWEVHTT